MLIKTPISLALKFFSKTSFESLKDWSNLGFINLDGSPLPLRDDLEARLIAPDGTNGRFFIVYPNYKNIKKTSANKCI